MKNYKFIVAILVAISICCAFVSCSSKNYEDGEKEITVVVTDESGEAVTDENGAVLTQEVDDVAVTDADGNTVTEVVTNKKGETITYSNGKNVTQAVTKKQGTQEVTNSKGEIETEAQTNENGVTVTKIVTTNQTTTAKETTTKKSGKNKDKTTTTKEGTTKQTTTKETTTKETTTEKRKLTINVQLPIDYQQDDTILFYIKNDDDEWEEIDSVDVTCDGSTYKYVTDKQYKGDIEVKAKLKNHKNSTVGKITADKKSITLNLSSIGIDIVGDDID
jgi:cell wall-associated NlpC family hydrolase